MFNYRTVVNTFALSKNFKIKLNYTYKYNEIFEIKIWSLNVISLSLNLDYKT